MVALAGAAVLLVVAVPVVLIALADSDPPGDAGADRLRAGAGLTAGASPQPSPTPSLPDWIDPCLLGTWQRTASQWTAKIDDVEVQFSGDIGATETYRSDGTATMVYRAKPPGTATYRGDRWEYIAEGRATASYRVTADGRLLLANVKTKGSWRYTRNGRVTNRGPLSISLTPADYVCSEDTLVEVGETYTNESKRVLPASATPVPPSTQP
jgi:hypothetical protein